MTTWANNRGLRLRRDESATDARRGKAKQQTLLGHPQRLSAEEVRECRERLAGLPVSQAEARVYGAGLDWLVGEEGFTINLCDLVVSDLVAALNVLSLDTASEAGETPDSTTAQDLWAAWQRSELAANTEGLFTSMAADGQAFLIADWGADGRPACYVNAAYDGDTGVEVLGVDGDGKLMVTVKHECETLVRDTKTGRVQRMIDWLRGLLGMSIDRAAVQYVERRIRTEYAFDRYRNETAIRCFVTDEGRPERQMRQDPETGEWLDVETGYVETWPYGNPVIPLVAPGGGELSELDTPQRLVNAAALDLAAAARTNGLRLLWTINCKPLAGGMNRNSASDVVYMKPGGIFELAPADPSAPASIGAIEAADLTGLMENFRLAVDTVLMIGRATYGIEPWQKAGIPSGVAVRLLNRPFDAKVSRYQERIDDALGQLFDQWQRMMGAAEPEPVYPVWRKPAYTTRQEDLADAAVAQNELDLPRSYIAGEVLGMTPEEAGTWDEQQQQVVDRQLEVARVMNGIAQQQGG